MSDKTIYGKSAQQIFEHLAEWMMSLGAGETTVKAVVCILPEPQQQWKLMEWMSKQMETHNPVEGEILEQALKMSKKR
jgi:hypothetical protein